MPRPRVDIFLDNENKGTLEEGQNVMTLDTVGSGAHKLVVLAKNQSGEVIDRKEINFTSEPATSVAQTTVETHRTESQVSAPPPAPPARVEVAAPPPPAPRARIESAPPPAPAPAREVASTLPATASSVPLVGLAGLGLLVTGLALRRRG